MKKKIFFVLTMALLLCCSAALSFAAPFTDNGNGMVSDNKTGLVWQQGEPGYMTWGPALSYCEGLSLGGSTDWRLPNIKELESITDDTRYYPAIDTSFFPGAYASSYWSSTTNAYSPDYAWYVYFSYGYVDYYSKGSSTYVRCVRGGQSGSFGDSDNDGLPDDWELKYFGDLVQNPGDDYDHDNLTNLEEYQRGPDPTNWDTDGDGVSDGEEVAQGTDPLDPNDFPLSGSCLSITNIDAKDIGSGDIPISGHPAKITVTVKNKGNISTGDRLLNAGIFSVDVQGEDCDLFGGTWYNNRKLVQAQTYDPYFISALNPNEETTLTYDYTFVNACFTDDLAVVLTSGDSKLLCKSDSSILKLEKHKYPFKPKPNPDAYTNCFFELTDLLVLPLLGNMGVVDGDMKIVLNGIKIQGFDTYGIYKAIGDKDIKSFGKAIWRYFYDSAKLVLNMTGKQIVSQFLSVIQAAYNEWNNLGCGEVIPSMWSLWTDFMDGIAEGILEAGYYIWNFHIGSPADIEVIDSQGNVIYVNKTGTASNTIADSVGSIIDNGTQDPIKSVSIIGNGPYTINLYGTSDGAGSFHINQPKSDGRLISINYKSIPLTPNTHASVTISDAATNYNLMIDSNGDGATDIIMEPDNVNILHCPNDSLKTNPGICGCGVADTDSDGDGVVDCNDGCPSDPAKINPGACGCNITDTDTDGDGFADCIDSCPSDPSKTTPGICGCGIADTDTDNDGIADCIDNCPAIYNPDQRDSDGDGKGDACEDARISGGAYNYPQTTTYKASFSVDVTKSVSLSGWFKYYYAKTRMNFVSTAITGVTVSGNTATISGTGTVNGAGNYIFTATISDSALDTFGITIKKSTGSLYYSAPSKAVSGGDLKISLL